MYNTVHACFDVKKNICANWASIASRSFACLASIFNRLHKTSRDVPSWGTRSRTLLKESRKRLNAQPLMRPEPMTSWLRGVCSTDVLQPWPKFVSLYCHFFIFYNISILFFFSPVDAFLPSLPLSDWSLRRELETKWDKILNCLLYQPPSTISPPILSVGK